MPIGNPLIHEWGMLAYGIAPISSETDQGMSLTTVQYGKRVQITKQENLSHPSSSINQSIVVTHLHVQRHQASELEDLVVNYKMSA